MLKKKKRKKDRSSAETVQSSLFLILTLCHPFSSFLWEALPQVQESGIWLKDRRALALDPLSPCFIKPRVPVARRGPLRSPCCLPAPGRAAPTQPFCPDDGFLPDCFQGGMSVPDLKIQRSGLDLRSEGSCSNRDLSSWKGR